MTKACLIFAGIGALAVIAADQLLKKEEKKFRVKTKHGNMTVTITGDLDGNAKSTVFRLMNEKGWLK